MAAAVRVARRNMRPTSLLDDVARLKGRSDIARPVWPVAMHQGELTAGRLVITVVPTTVDQRLGSSVSLVAADGHMAPDFDLDFSSRPDRFHGERVKIAQRAGKHRAN